MELYLMQHGACLPKEIDPDQPLSPVGRDQIDKSARAAGAMGLSFDYILASPKLRSRQTAEIVAHAVQFPPTRITVTEAVKAMTSPDETVDFLATLRNARRVFIAGHLQSLGDLAARLLTSGSAAHVRVSNGGLTFLDLPEVPTHAGVLMWHLEAKHLAAIADS